MSPTCVQTEKGSHSSCWHKDIHRLDTGQMVSNLNNLFFKIREANRDIDIMYSAILPRLYDSGGINQKVKDSNVQIQKMC